MYQPIHDPAATPRTVFDRGAGAPLDLPPLAGDAVADVAVIGGGFVGCSAALHLAEAGRKVVLVEGNAIGWGSAGRNAGQVAAHATKLDPRGVLEVYGPVYGPRLNEVGAGAPAFVTGLAERFGFDISVVRGGTLRAAHTVATAEKLRTQAGFWQEAGAPVEFLPRAEAAAVIGSDAFQGAMIDRRGIAINPLAFVRGLARAAISHGAVLHEHTRMTGIARAGEGWRVATDRGAIAAGQVLLCTNAYTDDTWPGLRQSVIPVRGYQIWTSPLPEAVRGRILCGISAMMDTRRLMSGVRIHPDGRMHFSGGVGFGPEHEPDLAGRVARIQALFPDLGPLEVEGWWSGWVTRGIADGWRLHRLAPGFLTAIGCNGRGVAMGAIMGRELARSALGAADDTLLVPLARPRPIPWYPLRGLLGPLAIRVYGWRDRREFERARRARGPARAA